MFSTLVAALLTQQVLTQTPCYAELAGLCSDPPKHTMIVVHPPQTDGAMPIQQEKLQMLPTFVLVTGFTSNTGAMATIVIPGIADENECHKLALKITRPSMAVLSIELPRRMPMWPMPFKMSCSTAASLGDASRPRGVTCVVHRAAPAVAPAPVGSPLG